MEDPGQKLKRLRERLNLRYRDVEEASQKIAQRRGDSEYEICLSRLSDIENKGTIPNIYRLYSLCAIYRVNLAEMMQMYGLDISQLPADAALVELERTHPVNFTMDGMGSVQLPLSLDPGIDIRKTTFLSRMIQRWGTLPLMLLNGMDLKNHRYAFLGTEDWFMYPLLQPGSLVLIDETRRKIALSGWTTEFDRPVYFFEHRQGYACAWCSMQGDKLVLQPHPASGEAAEVYNYPQDIDVIGQVVGVAMRLDPARRRRVRS